MSAMGRLLTRLSAAVALLCDVSSDGRWMVGFSLASFAAGGRAMPAFFDPRAR